MSSSAQPMTLQVARFVAEARGVVSLELVDPCGGELPEFAPGAHIELRLPNNQVRLYSLLNDSRERYRYVIAVALAERSEGGSSYIHGHVREGDLLQVMPPRNLFPLDTSAQSYCFIAGGIGVTPLLSMLSWCQQAGKPWRLLYCARSRGRAIRVEELAALPQVTLHFDDEQPQRVDLEALLAGVQPGEQVWCCGPQGMMQAVEQAAGHLPVEHLHFESFTAAPPADDLAEHPFDIVLRRSNLRLQVPVGRSILEVLQEHGIKVTFACRSGVCGACDTAVCAGEPDHRDMVLNAEQRASGKRMLICVSRAKGDVLELDL